MPTPAPITIGKRLIGDGQPCYVIAEAGSNHNCDMTMALQLIDVAADAGADAVKFQYFRADTLYPPAAGSSDYLGDKRSIDDIIRAMELPDDWIARLVEHTRARGLDFLCSAFDEAAVDVIDPFVDAFKCASYEMTHTPLLQHMARRGKPLLLSTGTANLDEIGQAVAAVRACVTGPPPLILLQCTAAYPAPAETANVRAITTLRDVFGVWTGLSDHTRDPIAAPMAAVALGAVIVEKHFTLSNDLPGPDHRFALEPDELRAMVSGIRAVQAVLGTGDKTVDAIEGELRQFARRSVFATKSIAAGQHFSPENTAVLRRGKLPGGLDPVDHPALMGRSAARDVQRWTAVQADDVGGEGPALGPQPVHLRRAVLADARDVWGWNNDPEVRAVSLNTAQIPWPDHERWFGARIRDPATRLWIVEHLGRSAGVVRIDRAGPSNKAIVSIALAASARGAGIGTRALVIACERFFGETGAAAIDALILADNKRSERAFARAGFGSIGKRTVGGRSVGVFQLTREAT